MTTMEIILVTLVAAICGMGSVLDERQTHRPLVACTLIGLVLGDLETGIIVGGTLELVALGWMNVGAAMAPDAALASVIAAILVIKGGQDKGSALAIAIPVAAAGQVLTIFVRTLTIFLQHKADDYAAQANFRGIEFCHFAGLSLQALRVAIPTFFVALVAGTDTVTHALNSIPEVVTRGLQIAGGFIVVVGYAMVINMMRAVVDHGTARRLRFQYGLNGPIAGKTGTTNNNADGWFIGCVPTLVTACWVGGEDRDIHFTSTAEGQGASTALPIWALFMRSVYKDKTLGYNQFEPFKMGRSRNAPATTGNTGNEEEQSANSAQENNVFL